MKKPGWPWKIYFLVFSAYVLFNMLDLFFPDSLHYVYYHILMAFHPGYRTAYGLAVIQVTCNLITLIPLFLFVFQIRLLNVRFWQWIFALRVIFDLTGHALEIKFFRSVFHADLQTFLAYLFIFLVLVVPSYIGCFLYAFRSNFEKIR